MFVRLGFILLALQVAVSRQAACSDLPDANQGLSLLDEVKKFKESNYPNIESSDLEELHELARMHPSTCSYRYYLDLHKMELKYKKNRELIGSLIRKFYLAKFHECKKTYEENVLKVMSTLDPEVDKKVDQVCNINDGHFRDLYEDQVMRTVKFMSQDETNLDLSLLGNKKNFFEKFDRVMGFICFRYLGTLYEEYNIYNLVLPREDPRDKKTSEQLTEMLASDDPNGVAHSWITKARKCKFIIDNMEELSDDVRKELKRQIVEKKGGAWNVFISRISGQDKKKEVN